MAATYLRPYKTAKGATPADTMRERFAYGLNPKKCAVVSSHLCDHATAHLEFMLVKSQYQAETGREAGRGHLFYQIRQGFPPGEVTPEEANRIGHETAMRWTKGKYQFFVCTHTDKKAIHNHIYFNATAYDRAQKFHNFLGSTFALRRLSDRVCIENGLSCIVDPKQHSKSGFRHYGEWLDAASGRPPTFKERLKTAIDACLANEPQNVEAFLAALAAAGFEHKCGRGVVLSFRAPAHGQARYTRLRADTLGEGYSQEELFAIIEGRAALPAKRRPPAGKRPTVPASGRVNLIVDIQEKLRGGKGSAYERWAKVYNLKMMAAALQYLQENNLLEYAQLERHAAGAVDRFHNLAGQIQKIEAASKRNAGLRAAVVEYAKTRPVFDEYKAKKYSRAYLAQHGDEIDAYRAAQEAMRELLAGQRLPKMDALKAEAGRLAAEKKALYIQYRAAQKQLRQAVAVKGNIDHLLGITDASRNKEQAR